VTTIRDPFVAEVVAGIEEMAIRHGYSVFLANCNADPVREAKVVESFEERRVDGIIVTASRVGALYMSHLSKMNIPIVLINNFQGEFVYSIGIDNLTASRDATAHLIDLGHRRIAYIGDRYGFQSDTDRFGGYRQALERADIPFGPDLVGGNFTSYWVYVAGPLVGAGLAVVAAYVLRGRGGGLAGSGAAQGDLFTEAHRPDKA